VATAVLAVTSSGGAAVAGEPALRPPAAARATAAGPQFPVGSRSIDCLKVKCVALTFDDGPGAQTSKLLGMLRHADARATFFPVGEVAQRRPAELRQIAAARHEIGNHTWSHSSLTLLGGLSIFSEVDRTARKVKAITGTRPTLVRPPYGALSGRVSSALAALGAPAILWSVDPLDWKYRNSTTVYRNVMRQVRPGSIVLLHDIHPTTVAAVPRILSALKKKGYHFVTVSELYRGKLKPGRTYNGRVAEYAKAHHH
jgi:peptidoglycan/xylan/chitin deacetylase (PgdA/CDA1 family)